MSNSNYTETNAANNEHTLMSLGQHLDELRRYLIRIIIFASLVFFILLFFKDFLFQYIILAPKEPWFFTNNILCTISKALNVDVLCINSRNLKLININLAGQFTAHLIVTLIASLIITFPYIIRQFWLFIKPALYSHEIKKINAFVTVTSCLFLIGILFGYFIIVPITINFLGNYNVSPEVENTISLMSFVSTISVLTLIMGLVFQLPVLIFYLTKAGLVNVVFLKKNRKIIFIVILIISAIITPPDVISQILVAIPLYILYEISIIIANKNKVN